MVDIQKPYHDEHCNAAWHGYKFCNEMIRSSIHADRAPKRYGSENSTAECDVMYGELVILLYSSSSYLYFAWPSNKDCAENDNSNLNDTDCSESGLCL